MMKAILVCIGLFLALSAAQAEPRPKYLCAAYGGQLVAAFYQPWFKPMRSQIIATTGPVVLPVAIGKCRWSWLRLRKECRYVLAGDQTTPYGVAVLDPHQRRNPDGSFPLNMSLVYQQQEPRMVTFRCVQPD